MQIEVKFATFIIMRTSQKRRRKKNRKEILLSISITINK